MSELTESQRDLCKRLSEMAKETAKTLGIKTQAVEPKHFALVVARYYGRVTSMNVELEGCLLWCAGKRKQVFTTMRFHNWCRNKMVWAKQSEMKKHEEDKLRNGTEYQRADLARRKQPRVQYQERDNCDDSAIL